MEILPACELSGRHVGRTLTVPASRVRSERSGVLWSVTHRASTDPDVEGVEVVVRLALDPSWRSPEGNRQSSTIVSLPASWPVHLHPAPASTEGIFR